MNKFIIYLLSLCSCVSLLGGGVEQALITSAQAVPSQYSMGVEKSWSCGPNSLARFLLLSGFKLPVAHDDIRDFVIKCPRSCGQPTTSIGYGTCATFAVTSLAASMYGWDGYSDVACALVTGACAVAPFAIEKWNQIKGVGKVGPTPRWLAGYGDSIIKSLGSNKRLSVGQYQDDKKLFGRIKTELDNGRPVIVLLNFGPLMWHYVTIISYNEDVFSYLETSGNIYTYRKDELVERMDFEKNPTTAKIKTALKHVGWYMGVDIDRYNLIYLTAND